MIFYAQYSGINAAANIFIADILVQSIHSAEGPHMVNFLLSAASCVDAIVQHLQR